MNRNTKVKDGANKIPPEPPSQEAVSQPLSFTLNYDDALSFQDGSNKIPPGLHSQEVVSELVFTLNPDDSLTFQDRTFVKLHGTIKEPAPGLLQRLRTTLAGAIATTFIVLVIREFLKKSDHTVLRPPGSTLLSVADFLCSKKTIEEIAKPLIADMQFEYYEALFAGRKLKAVWIRIRYTASFFMAIGLYRLLKFVATIFFRPSAR